VLIPSLFPHTPRIRSTRPKLPTGRAREGPTVVSSVPREIRLAQSATSELCGRVPVGRRPTGWCRPVRGTLHAQSTHTCAIPLCALTLPTYHEHSWIAFSCTSEPLQSDPLSQLTSPQLPYPARLPRERISANIQRSWRSRHERALARPPRRQLITC
jgi:hypothetical protein